jgi:sulfotransferase family protein
MSTLVYEQRTCQTRMGNEKIKVLFVAGSGRSGTTIMARLLGELEGFVNVGEAARYLFDRHLQAKNLPCGCGQSVPECPFWRDIVQEIPPDVSESGAALVRMRTFPWLLLRGRNAISAQYDAILSAISGVYRKVAQETGCAVIVDSSKNPANGLLVSLVSDVELHVVHVVRHPQNVVASWTKSKGYLAVHPARRVIAWWWSYNILAEALKLRAKTYRRIRYEDFVLNPGALLQQVARDTMGKELPSSFLEGTEATVHMQHILAGNPDKFGSGKVKIGDVNSPVATSRKLLVNLLTFPLQFRYRYLP